MVSRKPQCFPRFAGLIDSLPADAIVAVDMPIGLPDFTHKGGRGPETLVRALLGAAPVQRLLDPVARRRLRLHGTVHDRSSAGMRPSSRECRRAGDIGSAARRVDPGVRHLLRRSARSMRFFCARPELRQRVIESHPEVAFWRLNGGHAMRLPKKVKGLVNPPGMAERAGCFRGLGLAGEFLGRTPPRGAADRRLPRRTVRCCSSRRATRVGKRCPSRPARRRRPRHCRSRSGLDGPRRHANGQDNRAVCTATLIAAAALL